MDLVVLAFIIANSLLFMVMIGAIIALCIYSKKYEKCDCCDHQCDYYSKKVDIIIENPKQKLLQVHL